MNPPKNCNENLKRSIDGVFFFWSYLLKKKINLAEKRHNSQLQLNQAFLILLYLLCLFFIKIVFVYLIIFFMVTIFIFKIFLSF